MNAPCPAIVGSLAEIRDHWVATDQGHLEPMQPVHTAYAAALRASSRLHAHGWRYNHVVPIRNLHTMLLVERTIPGGH